MASLKPTPFIAEVVHAESLSTGWRRVVLDMEGAFPRLQPHLERVVENGLLGAFHMGFYFPVDRTRAATWPRMSGMFADFFDGDASLYGDPDIEIVGRRLYTIRPVEGDWRRMELNFVMHGDGLASNWAAAATVGSPLIANLGFGDRVMDIDELPAVQTYVLLGDETCVPTVATMLERLPAGCDVFVCIEVGGPEDEWTFETKANATIQWIHRDAEAGTTDYLRTYCENFAWPANGSVHVWAGAEGRQIYALRKQLREEVGLQRGQYQLLGFWRRGIATEQVLALESDMVAEGLAAGKPFAQILRGADPDQDQPNKTPFELLDVWHENQMLPEHDLPIG
jgi:NADPH-dependent ferric siderophore reductase